LDGASDSCRGWRQGGLTKEIGFFMKKIKWQHLVQALVGVLVIYFVSSQALYEELKWTIFFLLTGIWLPLMCWSYWGEKTAYILRCASGEEGRLR
jgi:hypothetical protein